MSKKKGFDWLSLVSIGIVAAVVIGLVVWRVVDSGDSEDNSKQSNKSDQEGSSQTSSTDDTLNNEYPDDIPETIPPDSPEAEKDPISLRQPPADVQISCDEVAVYNGQFVESGADQPVTDVAAILVTNKSDQYLDYAKLTYKVDGNEAIFIVSGLNAGKSAWVLESKGLKATSTSKFEYVDALTAYKEHVVRDPKELDIKFGDGILQIKNVSDDALEDVIIYYKVVHQDGKYFGGRTYMVRVESLEPGQSVQTDAGHFKKDSTQIVRVDMTKATDNSE